MTCRGGSKVKIREAGTGVQVAFFFCLFVFAGRGNELLRQRLSGWAARFVREGVVTAAGAFL